MTGKKATGRTKQLSLKSTPEFHQRLKVLASKEKCLMIEVLEEALKLYEENRKERKKADKENVVPEVSQDEVPQKRAEKRPLLNEEAESGSKKRKISDY